MSVENTAENNSDTIALVANAGSKWHAMNVDDAFEVLKSDRNGLTGIVASQRFEAVGPNELPHKKEDPAWLLLLRQFNSPLMYLMLLATAVSVFVGHNSDTIFIIVVMVSNALVGFYQEYKANESLNSLKDYVKRKARVLRGGREQEVLASQIVPGDVIVLRAGDKIPADARIFANTGLRVNESSLTGESKAVEKSPNAVAEEAETGDRSSMVYMGTLVEEGSAKALVVETGVHTEYGDIVRLLEETPEEATPLQRMIMSLSKAVGIFITFVVAIILIEGYITGRPFEEMFAVALALFVSAIPEGLLPAITIVLTIGMRRIMRSRGLVRRLAATETLGGVTVICTDKTGTLTEGKMEVQQILTAAGNETISEENKGDLSMTAKHALFSAVLASDAYVEKLEGDDGEAVIRGRPTEQAFIKAGITIGLAKDSVESDNETLDTVFFSSERKFSATLRKSGSGERTLYAIGAPERIMERSSSLQALDTSVSLDSPEFKKLLTEFDDLVSQGFRLVACAYKQWRSQNETIGDETKDMTLIGFIALNDPIRPQVPRALKETKEAGIRTVIVTGDHQLTARAVAKKIGFKIEPHHVLEGNEIEDMGDDDLEERTRTTLLYARVSPRHKLRIVQAFQNQGEVVAMFGDGVNDAPALKAANIGVAVNTEVDAAREVADIVLLDSGFNTIVKAIEQGRIIFNNIKRVFFYLITQDFSQFFVFFLSIAFGLPLPLLAVQLLFVNLVESGLPDLALTTESDGADTMRERPRKSTESILNRNAYKWMFSAFAVSGGIAMVFFLFVLTATGDITKTRTMLTVLLCLESLFLALSLRSFDKPIFRRDIFDNKWLTGAIAISAIMIVGALHLDPLRQMLSLAPLSPHELVLIVSANLAEIALIDAFKLRFLSKKTTGRRLSSVRETAAGVQAIGM